MSDESGPKSRGRKKLNFLQTEIEEILRLLAAGHGRATACRLRNVTYHRFVRQLREDAMFAEAVRTIERGQVEDCNAVLLHMARSNKYVDSLQLRAAIAYLARHDRVRESRHVRREKARKAAKAAPSKAGKRGG